MGIGDILIFYCGEGKRQKDCGMACGMACGMT